MFTTLAGLASGAGSADGGPGVSTFNAPVGIATDGIGNIYVADTGNNTVRRIIASGAVTTLAGLPPPQQGGHIDGHVG